MEVTIHMNPTLFTTTSKLTLKLFTHNRKGKTNVISAVDIDLHFQDTSKILAYTFKTQVSKILAPSPINRV